MYTAVLLKNGFDDMETLAAITDADLEDLGVMPPHRRLLRRKLMHPAGAAQEQEAEVVSPVTSFLQDIGLPQYASVLVEHGFDDMETLVLIDDLDLKDMGFRLGHMVKLKKRLREYELQASVEEEPLPGWTPEGRQTSAARATLTALTSSGLSAVEKSWEQVQAFGVSAVGGRLYKHFFAMAPEAMELYPAAVRRKYSEWTIDEEELQLLQSTTALRKLFGKVVNAVGCTVVGFQDMGRLVPMLEKLGARHGTYGVGESQYAVLGKALDLTLADLLGPAYSAEVQQSWKLVFSFMTAVMVEGHRQAIAEQERRARGDSGTPESASRRTMTTTTSTSAGSEAN